MDSPLPGLLQQVQADTQQRGQERRLEWQQHREELMHPADSRGDVDRDATQQ